jgi:hypothetical protein
MVPASSVTGLVADAEGHMFCCAHFARGIGVTELRV